MNWHKIDNVLFYFYSVYVVNYNAITTFPGKGIFLFHFDCYKCIRQSKRFTRFVPIKRYRKIRLSFLSLNPKFFSISFLSISRHIGT